MMLLLLFGFVVSAAAVNPSLEQLSMFKNRTNGPIGIMTTSNGAKVDINDTTALASPLIFNEFFMDSMTHFVRERIPERVVHVKGAGAFGYFQVTHNVTDICKAKFLSEIGKETPVVVRFSPTILDKGGPDSSFNSFGFAIKFYTEDGNFDMLSFNTPIFVIKDPTMFPSLIRSLRRNPVTNMKDQNTFWDFVTLRPETLFFFMYLFAGYGLPYSYRQIPGFSIHTYQIYNKDGQSYFARFHFSPDLGVKNFNIQQIAQLTAIDLDHLVRDLYNAIEIGEFPSWSVSLQVLKLEDINNNKFDVFDLTKKLSLEKYPLRPIGKIVLNRNPKNYFADVEQLAFGPNNLVPGILGSPDKMFEARRLAYKDAQLYRLGANFDKIPVNCPFSKVKSYNRDGVPPIGTNGEDAPNYYPNSFNGPIPDVDENRPSLISVTNDDSYNFDQAAEMYTNELNEEQKNAMILFIVKSLKDTQKNIQKRAIKMFNTIHKDIGSRVSAGLIEDNN